MMRLNSQLLFSTALFLGLSACEGSPTQPTPPPPTCTYTLSVTTLTFGAAGGTAAVTVTTTSACTWTATSDREWITITSGASGTGTGTAAVSVSANPGVAVRTGTLTIAGQIVSVSEAAQPPCSVALTPTSARFSQNPATGTFTVTTPPYCQWTASSLAAWLTITSGTQGAGNGTVAYSVERNRDTTARAANIVVNEKSFGVTQDADTVSCDYAVSPVDFTPCMSVPSTMTAMITTQASCSWTALPTASWITVTEGQTGSGPGSITFRVSENWDAPRQGLVEVRWPTVTAGQNLRVFQAGCYYAVSPGSISLAAAGGPGRFEVLQQSSPYTCGGPLQNACLWTAVSQASWITITTAMPQVGDNPVNFVVAPNNTGVPRSGTIVVRDKVVTITQAG